MDDKEASGIFSVVFGLIVLLVSLLPDAVGLEHIVHRSNLQSAGALLGLTIVAVGVFLSYLD
jgi:hypothetical protein